MQCFCRLAKPEDLENVLVAFDEYNEDEALAKGISANSTMKGTDALRKSISDLIKDESILIAHGDSGIQSIKKSSKLRFDPTLHPREWYHPHPIRKNNQKNDSTPPHPPRRVTENGKKKCYTYRYTYVKIKSKWFQNYEMGIELDPSPLQKCLSYF